MKFDSIQRAIQALCLFSLSACSPSNCKEWTFDRIATKTPCFNSGRLLLSGQDSKFLEIEIIRNSLGIRCYLNILLLKAPCLSNNAQLTEVEICFEDQEFTKIEARLFDGGQRLLFSDDVTNCIVQSLLEEKTFTIKLGNKTLEVVSTKFRENYANLLAIPIA